MRIYVIIFGLAGMLSSTRGSRKCKDPRGYARDTMVSGCLERVCTRFGRESVWLDNIATSVCCSYQGMGYPKGSTITSVKAEDGCSNVTLTCEDEKGMPAIKMKVESDCDAVTFVEALEEIVATCCPCEITSTSATTSPTITPTTPTTPTPVNTAPSTSEPGEPFDYCSDCASNGCPSDCCEDCSCSCSTATTTGDADDVSTSSIPDGSRIVCDADLLKELISNVSASSIPVQCCRDGLITSLMDTCDDIVCAKLITKGAICSCYEGENQKCHPSWESNYCSDCRSDGCPFPCCVYCSCFWISPCNPFLK